MSLDACARLVERGDPDRFRVAMAAPPSAREALFPLYAFNLEVARARLRQARADRRIAGAAGRPTVNATASASRQRISENGLPIGGGGQAGARTA